MYHLFLILSLLYAYAQDIATGVADKAEFRSYVATVNSTTNSISVAGAKLSLSADGTHTVSGALDAAAFKFVAAGINASTPQVAVGHTILDASGSVSWAPSSQGGSFFYHILGAWAEIIAGLSNIFLYQERNGVPGFQYSLGDNIWDCTVSNGLDCFQENSNIDLTSDVAWSPLNITKLPCPASTGYSSNCSIWRISSTASLPSGTPVLQITFKLASQNVLYGPSNSSQSQIGPDQSKYDIIITYPWAAKAQNRSIGNVAVGGYAGGKAGIFGINAGSFQSKQAFIFPGDNGKSAVLAFDGSATIDAIGKSTNLLTISGAAITAYNCNSCSVFSLLVITAWKLSVAQASVGGWSSLLFFLSWDSVGPTTVVYDPLVGSTASSNSSNSTVPAPGSVPEPTTTPQPSGSQPQPPSGTQPQTPPPSSPSPSGSLFLAPTLFTGLLSLIFYGLF